MLFYRVKIAPGHKNRGTTVIIVMLNMYI